MWTRGAGGREGGDDEEEEKGTEVRPGAHVSVVAPVIRLNNA